MAGNKKIDKELNLGSTYKEQGAKLCSAATKFQWKAYLNLFPISFGSILG